MMRDAPRFHFGDSVGNLLGLIVLARLARYRLVFAIVGFFLLLLHSQESLPVNNVLLAFYKPENLRAYAERCEMDGKTKAQPETRLGYMSF